MLLSRQLRRIVIALTIVAGTIVVLIGTTSALSGVPAQTGSAFHTVCESGQPTCDFSSIQAAVDAANSGDLIKVASGIYTGVNKRPAPPDYGYWTTVTQTVYISKELTIQGGYDPSFGEPPDPGANPTIIDANGDGRVALINGPLSVTLSGLELQGGVNNGLGGDSECGLEEDPGPGCDWGGALFSSGASLTIDDSRLIGNTTGGIGGGIFASGGSLTISNSQIISNVSGEIGGGVFLWDGEVMIADSIFVNNQSSVGGGASLPSSSGEVARTTFSENKGGRGGAVWLCFGGEITFEDNLFTKNVGENGGVFNMCSSSHAILNRNWLTGNLADLGGGIFFDFRSSAEIANTIIAGNIVTETGAGIYMRQDSHGHLIHTTIADNGGGDGSGIYLEYGSLVLTNTIIASQTVGVQVQADSAINMDYTLWGDGAWANGVDWAGDGHIVTGIVNFWGDPAFVQPSDDNYHIGEDSAAIDRALMSSLTTDVDGQQRPNGAAADIGADEYRVNFVPTDWLYLPTVSK